MEWWIDHDRHPIAYGHLPDESIESAHLKSLALLNEDGEVIAEKPLNIIPMAGDTLNVSWELKFH
jgi:hypothetical protein